MPRQRHSSVTIREVGGNSAFKITTGLTVRGTTLTVPVSVDRGVVYNPEEHVLAPTVVDEEPPPPLFATFFLDNYTGDDGTPVDEGRPGAHIADTGSYQVVLQGGEGTLELDGLGNVVQTVVGDNQVFTNSIGPSLGFYAELEFTLATGVRDNFLELAFYQDAPGFDPLAEHRDIVRFSLSEAPGSQGVWASYGNGDVLPGFSITSQTELDVPITFEADTNYVVRIEVDAEFGRWSILVNDVQWGTYQPFLFDHGGNPFAVRGALWLGEYGGGPPESIKLSRFEVGTMPSSADTTPPTVAAEQLITFTEGQPAEFILGQLIGTDDGTIQEWRFVDTGTNVSPDGFFTLDITGQLFLTAAGEAGAGNEAGTFTHSVVARDAAGNLSTPVDFTVEVNAAPLPPPEFMFQAGGTVVGQLLTAGYNASAAVGTLMGTEMIPLSFSTSHVVTARIQSNGPDFEFADQVLMVVEHNSGGTVLAEDVPFTTLRFTIFGENFDVLRSAAAVTTVGSTLRFTWTNSGLPRFMGENDVMTLQFLP